MAQNIDVTYEMYDQQLRTPEQEQAENLLLERKHFILGFEPGKGKTYPVIHAIRKWLENIRSNLWQLLSS